ncbi:MAG: TIGR04282 family arsenosugar biosynthesis glycosyltransferase [Actinobacteria bacterium]|nr:TIGR04282 family arsenosugar biosynthesis glycosyltransferase [Actinomycetota bacterium]
MLPNVLVIMAKYPAPGLVKTRLCPPLEATSAAELYRAFLTDTIEKAALVRSAEKFLAVYPGGLAEQLRIELGEGFKAMPQTGSALGERLGEVFNRLLRANRVVVIGSDTPTLPPVYIEKAFELLREFDLVLGPASDGGYYLVGLSIPAPGLFSAVEWGGEKVLTQTLYIADALRLSTALLPEWYDIDTEEDLRRLAAELQVNSAAARQSYKVLALLEDQLKMKPA